MAVKKSKFTIQMRYSFMIHKTVEADTLESAYEIGKNMKFIDAVKIGQKDGFSDHERLPGFGVWEDY